MDMLKVMLLITILTVAKVLFVNDFLFWDIPKGKNHTAGWVGFNKQCMHSWNGLLAFVVISFLLLHLN